MESVKGWAVVKVSYPATDTLKKGQELEVDIELRPVAKDRSYGKVPVQAAVKVDGETYSINLRSIQYDHIPNLNYFRQPVTNILSLNLKTVGKKIGFIEGAGDYMATALQLMGYEVDVLKEAALASSKLSQYDAIVTGVRAYNINARLSTHYQKLMKYVENGGNLVIQYNTSNQFGALKFKIGPYPFDIARTRVTDEKARITVLKPQHQLMNFPNKINDNDFDEWVQERSIYHASNFGDKYESFFSMSDANDKPDAGSLIMTKYGKGNFVYTGLVFFRQLPAGVPGAYRLLANIIALNKKPVL
jgi:hypothetical protein